MGDHKRPRPKVGFAEVADWVARVTAPEWTPTLVLPLSREKHHMVASDGTRYKITNERERTHQHADKKPTVILTSTWVRDPGPKVPRSRGERPANLSRKSMIRVERRTRRLFRILERYNPEMVRRIRGEKRT